MPVTSLTEPVEPECQCNRLYHADPERDVDMVLHCPNCDACVSIDADAPRRHLETKFTYDVDKDDPRVIYAYDESDRDRSLGKREVPEFKMVFMFGNDEEPFAGDLHELLMGHAVYICTKCHTPVINGYEYTYDDDEWEGILEERREEEAEELRRDDH